MIRFGIQRELAMELAKTKHLTCEQKAQKTINFVKEIKTMPIAINTREANTQHYEVPDEFFQIVLGPCMKYSSCYFSSCDGTDPTRLTGMPFYYYYYFFLYIVMLLFLLYCMIFIYLVSRTKYVTT